MSDKENIEEWKPHYLCYKGVPVGEEPNKVYYKRSWMCKDTGAIHQSEKAVLKCEYCSKKYFKPEKL